MLNTLKCYEDYLKVITEEMGPALDELDQNE